MKWNLVTGKSPFAGQASTAPPVGPTNAYVAEDDTTQYAAEDGTTIYVQET